MNVMNIKSIFIGIGISFCMSAYAAQAMEDPETKSSSLAISQSMKSPFDHIDDTIAVKMFGHFDASDLGRCAQVSKQWNALSSDEWVWKHVAKNLESRRIHFAPKHVFSLDTDESILVPQLNYGTATWKEIVTTGITYWKNFHEGRKRSQPLLKFTHRTLEDIKKEKRIYKIETEAAKEGKSLSAFELLELNYPDVAQIFRDAQTNLSDDQREQLKNPTPEQLYETSRESMENCTIS